jgi:hypothetical protein
LSHSAQSFLERLGILELGNLLKLVDTHNDITAFLLRYFFRKLQNLINIVTLGILYGEVCQNILVPALDAGPQKNRSYQSDIYTVSFHAIPRQAREQDSFDTFITNKVIIATYFL